MVSIRAKVHIIITLIIIVISFSSLGVSLLFNQNHFLDTVKADLSVISAIAEEMISYEVNLIKAQVRGTAGLVSAAENSAELLMVLEEEFEWYRYMNLAVLDASGVAASYGDTTESYDDYMRNPHVQRAFSGESVMSTTEYDLKGELVFRVWTPAGEGRILGASIQGLVFADIVSKFRIWETGSIFILDSQGTLVAHYLTRLVRERQNFTESRIEERDPSWRGAIEFFSKMIQGGSGVGNYRFNGVERICAYTPVKSSDGWVLAASAPIRESPLSRINQVLVISTAVFMILGFITAALAVNSIATPLEQIKEQNIRLEELRKIAEEASETKTQFLANMSHEMRTPLNAIIGLSELALGSDELGDAAYGSMEKIYVSGMTLLGIINDILDISKIKSGKFTLIPAEYDLPSMINDTVIQNVIRAGSKPIQFNLRVNENLPQKIIGDELRIKQIFNNLLSNAFKYTDRGSVDWDISVETGEEGIWLVSSVRDTGIGIRREDMDNLFTNYNQVDIKSNRRIEGTGLGLSITKNLVELMGGGIAVESEYGKGSVFSIRIRQQCAGDGVIGRDTAESLASFQYTVSRRSRNEKLARVWIPYASVLVVDDVSANLDVARGMMKPYGMTVDCVLSGQKAIELIREGKKYAAIFMDHMMPGMDGIEAARIIRTGIGTEYAKTVPLIALTANAIIGAEDLFLGSGFQAFLSKPIDIISLDRVINRFVRDKKRESELGLSGRKPGAEDEKPENKAGILAGRFVEGVDFDTGLKRFDYNEEIYLQVVSSYLFQLKSINSKIRINPGGNLQGDYKIAVHSLKSSSYSIGARQIGRIAEELEQAASSGDMDFINAHNGDLTTALEKLIPGLETLLEEINELNTSPPRPEPDPVLLGRLMDACADYDMAKLDAVIDELGKYRYESQGDLVRWLKEQSGKSELEKIRERLSDMGIKRSG